MQVGGAGDRGGIGRLVREEADSFFWNGLSRRTLSSYRGLLGSGKGMGSPFPSEVV